jgi:hypothetical protein
MGKNAAYELSTGSGFLSDNPIYGLSIVIMDSDGKTKKSKQNKCYFSLPLVGHAITTVKG